MKKITLTFMLLLPIILIGQTHIWTSNGGNNEFSNPGNWDVLSVPDYMSDVLISGNFEVICNPKNVTLVLSDILLGPPFILFG